MHDAIARVAGIGISLPWASSADCVTKTEFDVWTWRSWKVLFGVQSTAYAGFAFGPEAAEGACDLMDSLAVQGEKGSTEKRHGSVPTMEDSTRLSAQQSLAGAQGGGNAAGRGRWRRARRPHLAVWPLRREVLYTLITIVKSGSS